MLYYLRFDETYFSYYINTAKTVVMFKGKKVETL